MREGTARVTRENGAHALDGRSIDVGCGDGHVEIAVLLRQRGFLRAVELVLEHLNGKHDRDRRLVAARGAARDEPGLRDGRRDRDDKQNDGDHPIGACGPSKDGVGRHEISRSGVSGTSAGNWRMTPSTSAAGKREKRRIAQYM